MRVLSPAAERFLRELERGLAPLPDAERRDVVAEIRSHLLDRAGQGDDGVASFGDPRAYAAAFLEERALAGALARGSSFALGRALVAGARGAGALAGTLALAIVHLVGAALVACAALKPAFPARVGFLVSDVDARWVLGAYFGGSLDGMREVLGGWAIPAFLVPGLALLWGGNRGLRRLARRRLARAASSLR